MTLQRQGGESWRMKKPCWPWRERNTWTKECGPFSGSRNGHWQPASMSMGISVTRLQQLDSSSHLHRRGHSFTLGGYREAIFCRNIFNHVLLRDLFGILTYETAMKYASVAKFCRKLLSSLDSNWTPKSERSPHDGIWELTPYRCIDAFFG